MCEKSICRGLVLIAVCAMTCSSSLESYTLPAARFLHEILDRVGHGAREQSHHHRVHREASNGLAEVELLVLLLQGNDRHAAHDQRSQVEVGEVTGAGCGVLGEAEGCGDEHDDCGKNQGGKRLFHGEVLLGVFVCCLYL